MPNERIKVSAAVTYVKEKHGYATTAQTIINWCRKHNIGIQLGSPHGLWMVDVKKLDAFMTTGTRGSNNER